jgi:hypothetical protein
VVVKVFFLVRDAVVGMWVRCWALGRCDGVWRGKERVALLYWNFRFWGSFLQIYSFEAQRLHTVFCQLFVATGYYAMFGKDGVSSHSGWSTLVLISIV